MSQAALQGFDTTLQKTNERLRHIMKAADPTNERSSAERGQ
jgi:hypothetical protein